ncbi:MAG: squalene synthase HpnC [Brachymonas sp.]|nr:squalene synthase HpnC [Brachymonas sp.]
MQSTAAHGVQHYENFPVASWLTPAHLRPAIVAIYWFARVADDLADEGDASAEQRLTELAAYRADLLACSQNLLVSPRWAGIFKPLAEQIAAHQLPVNLLTDLLDAFEQDVRYTHERRWYVSMQELLDYSRRSANPVGRLLLHLYKVKGEAELAASDAICSVLQLINFWQDISRDVPRGRYYLPLKALQAHGLSPAAVLALEDTPDTIKNVALCADFSLSLMQKGFKLPAAVQQQVGAQMGKFAGWRLSLELRCVIHGGLRILEKIRAMEHRTLQARPKISAWDGCVILWRALMH